MKKVIKLTESDLTNLIKRVVNENLSDRKGDLYMSINDLIEREFEDVEPSVVADVLANIMDHHKGQAYRRKHNIKGITADEVRKHFKNS